MSTLETGAPEFREPDYRERVRAGVIAVASAYLLWGVLPLYLKLIGFADPREVLGWRILWTLPCAAIGVALIGGFRRGFAEAVAALKPNVILLLGLSACCIFANWWIYVWAVANDRVIQAALAYFIAPLVQVAFGVAFFKERLSRGQLIALALAILGVIVQGAALGRVPWVSLTICASWSFYSLIRRQAPAPAAAALFVETAWLIAPAVGLLMIVAGQATLTFTQSTHNAVLLALSGVATAVPLTLFAIGARRLRFSTIGLLQFIAPSMQFLLGVAFGEPFGALHAASFAAIWAGLIVFSWDAWTRERAARHSAA